MFELHMLYYDKMDILQDIHVNKGIVYLKKVLFTPKSGIKWAIVLKRNLTTNQSTIKNILKLKLRKFLEGITSTEICIARA